MTIPYLQESIFESNESIKKKENRIFKLRIVGGG
jgi:hypothetical protein